MPSSRIPTRFGIVPAEVREKKHPEKSANHLFFNLLLYLYIICYIHIMFIHYILNMLYIKPFLKLHESS